MGFAPPPDAPSPAEQDAVSADASFEPSPAGPTLCGFQLPLFGYSFGLNFKFPPFPFPPTFDYFLALSCDLSNPINASAGFGQGGGRVPQQDPDSDPDATADL